MDCIQNIYVDGDYNILFPDCEVLWESIQWFKLSQRQGTGTIWKFILSMIIGTIVQSINHLSNCPVNETEFANY